LANFKTLHKRLKLITDDLCRFDALIRSTIATIIVIAAVRIRMNRPRKLSWKEKKNKKIELVIGSKCNVKNKKQASIQAALKNNILLGKHFQVLIAGFKTVGVEDETGTIIALYDLHISRKGDE
jgi:hypothetical protein